MWFYIKRNKSGTIYLNNTVRIIGTLTKERVLLKNSILHYKDHSETQRFI
jgi:hypothetical protein